MKLPSGNKKVLSIDFGSSQIKVIEGQSSKKGIHVFRTFTINIPKGVYKNGEILKTDIIANELNKALKQRKISTELAYAIINSSSIITREVSIPKISEKEVNSLIGYQLDEILPVDPYDYVVNHIILDTIIEDEIEKLNILLIAIPKTMVLSHLELLKNAGLKPQVLDFQGNTMAKLIGFNEKINNNYNTSDIVVAAVDIGYDSSKLSIIKNGRIEVTRVLDPGAKDLYNNISSLFDYSLEDAEEKVKEIEEINAGNEEFTDYYRLLNVTNSTMNTLFENIETIFRYYRTRDMGNDINVIVLQGGLSNINGLDNLFSNYFNIPTTILTTLDKIKFDGDLSKYSNAIGGLIRISEV